MSKCKYFLSFTAEDYKDLFIPSQINVVFLLNYLRVA